MQYVATGGRVHERQLTGQGTGADWMRHQDRAMMAGLQSRHVAQREAGLAAIHVAVLTQSRSHSGTIGGREDQRRTGRML